METFVLNNPEAVEDETTLFRFHPDENRDNDTIPHHHPRNGTLLRGTVLEYEAQPWLEVHQLQQPDSAVWIDVENAYLPFQLHHYNILQPHP